MLLKAFITLNHNNFLILFLIILNRIYNVYDSFEYNFNKFHLKKNYYKRFAQNMNRKNIIDLSILFKN